MDIFFDLLIPLVHVKIVEPLSKRHKLLASQLFDLLFDFLDFCHAVCPCLLFFLFTAESVFNTKTVAMAMTDLIGFQNRVGI